MAEIQLTYGEETSFQQILGFEMASAWWSNILEDDVAINIHVDGTHDLPTNVVGGALASIEDDEDYKDIHKYLERDITSASDSTAIEHLPNKKEFSIVANGDSSLSKTKKMRLTRANAKALGMENPDSSRLDGYIVVNDLSQQSDYRWDYGLDRTAEFSEGNLDFFSVAVHEVGHILGFVSGVDDMEWLDTIADEHNKHDHDDDDDDDDDDDGFRINFKDDAMKFSTPFDLYRFSEQSADEDKRDLSVGNHTYFSINGGEERLANFSTGKDQTLGGDGFQASHWQHQENAIGIMDPVLFTHQRREISALDVLALDVIGWDINEDGLAFDLDQLQSQAEHGLAQKLGIATDQLQSQGQYLTDRIKCDRYDDIEKMIDDSDVYEWGSRRRSRRGSRWQEVYDLLQEEGKYQTFDQIIDQAPPEAVQDITLDRIPNVDSSGEQPFIVEPTMIETGEMSLPHHSDRPQEEDISGAPGAFIPETEMASEGTPAPINQSLPSSSMHSGTTVIDPTNGHNTHPFQGFESSINTFSNVWFNHGSSHQAHQDEVSQWFSSVLEKVLTEESFLHSGVRLLRMF